jgi:hypothetical protein
MWSKSMLSFRTIALSLSAGFALLSLVGVANPSSAATDVEFASFYGTCTYSGFGNYGIPGIAIDLHNVPTGASPTGTATMTFDGRSSSTYFGYSGPETKVPGVFHLGDPSPPAGAETGQAFSISLTWNDGVGGSGSQGPQIVGTPGCSTTSFGAVTAMAATQSGDGIWSTTSGGKVGFNGQSLNYGDMSYLPLNAPIVDMAVTPDGQGYWLLGGDGGVFSFGLAHFYGSTGGLHLDAPVVGMAATPDGGGYYFVAKDGGVFAYGDAVFQGSMGGKPLNQPIVGMAVDQATGGYWLVASDGGIFSFDAPFHGSTGALALSQPIVGMEAAPDGSGYRLAARDGGIFSFDLPFAGSAVGLAGTLPITGFAGVGDDGYWLIDSCGGVYAFGSAAQFTAAGICGSA